MGFFGDSLAQNKPTLIHVSTSLRVRRLFFVDYVTDEIDGEHANSSVGVSPKPSNAYLVDAARNVVGTAEHALHVISLHGFE